MGPLTAFDEELQQNSTWYLLDNREPMDVEAKTVLTSNPDRNIYKVTRSLYLMCFLAACDCRHMSGAAGYVSSKYVLFAL